MAQALIHELSAAIGHLQRDEVWRCRKVLARCKQVLRQLTEQWSVLETMTPAEYMEFRDVLGPSSGFQSLQYRTRRVPARQQERGDARRVRPRTRRPGALQTVLDAPGLYDEFLCYLARWGHPVDPRHLQRDWRQPHTFDATLVPVFDPSTRTPNATGASTRCARTWWISNPSSSCALPPHAHGDAHHRLQARHRRIERRGLPQTGRWS